MKQIKTIYHKNSDDFDVEVNNELVNGWTLTWRAAQVYNGDVYFFAGLERDVAEPKREDIDYDAKLCEDCKHFHVKCGEEPCASCTDEGIHWEAKE